MCVMPYSYIIVFAPERSKSRPGKSVAWMQTSMPKVWPKPLRMAVARSSLEFQVVQRASVSEVLDV